MEKLIDVVNKLQAVFSSTKIGDLNKEIQLPQIVVIGAQDNIYLTFGPETEFAIFEHRPEEIFINFDEVCKEIQEDTDFVAGENKGICSEPIILSIYSHNVVQLSLVDLPGITKVPIGAQPCDIEEQIRNMIMGYIDNPNSIILGVSAANVDFATSEAIKLAQEVDPRGERTVAVLTKLDLMDKGTNAMKELMGEIIPIKRGIVGVINRSQADIMSKKEIKDCLEYERNFLHQNYPSIVRRNGIKYLAEILRKMLEEHIYSCLPDFKARIEENTEQCEKEMEKLGETVIDPHSKLLDLIKQFVTAYNNTIMGVGAEMLNTIKELNAHDYLFGGAKISWIFHTAYSNDLDGITLEDDLKNENIYKAVLQTEGLHPSIIVPEKCFEGLSIKQIKRLEKPSLKCVDRVHEEMRNAIRYCGDEELKHEFKRFPAIASQIYNFVVRMLEERAKIHPKSINAHAGFINTKHPDFSSERALLMMLMKLEPHVYAMVRQQAEKYSESSRTILVKLKPHVYAIDRQQAGKYSESYVAKLVKYIEKSDMEIEQKYEEITTKMSRRDRENCILIGRLVKVYFNIIRKAVQDHTPKEIYSELINYVKENLQNGLLMQVLKNYGEMDVLFKEDQEIEYQRLETENRLETLRKAGRVLDELYDYEI